MPEESIWLELATLRDSYEKLLGWSSGGMELPVPKRVATAALRARRLLSIDRIRDAFPESGVLAELAASVPSSHNAH